MADFPPLPEPKRDTAEVVLNGRTFKLSCLEYRYNKEFVHVALDAVLLLNGKEVHRTVGTAVLFDPANDADPQA